MQVRSSLKMTRTKVEYTDNRLLLRKNRCSEVTVVRNYYPVFLESNRHQLQVGSSKPTHFFYIEYVKFFSP